MRRLIPSGRGISTLDAALEADYVLSGTGIVFQEVHHGERKNGDKKGYEAR